MGGSDQNRGRTAHPKWQTVILAVSQDNVLEGLHFLTPDVLAVCRQGRACEQQLWAGPAEFRRPREWGLLPNNRPPQGSAHFHAGVRWRTRFLQCQIPRISWEIKMSCSLG